MRILLLAITATLLNPIAFATPQGCPDLSGSFTCETPSHAETIVISQESELGINRVKINGSEMLLDNELRSIEGDDTFRSASMRAWCQDASIRYEIIGDFYANDHKIGQTAMVTIISLDKDSLSQSTIGIVKNSFGEFPIDDRMVCLRKQH